MEKSEFCIYLSIYSVVLFLLVLAFSPTFTSIADANCFSNIKKQLRWLANLLLLYKLFVSQI